MWVALPEPTRVFLVSMVVGIWTYTVALARAIWPILDPMKPFFVWLGNLDWLGGLHKAEKFMVHLSIGLFAAMLAMGMFVIAVDFLKFILTGTTFKEQREKFSALDSISIPVGILFGYYSATSSYAEAFVNWFLK